MFLYEHEYEYRNRNRNTPNAFTHSEPVTRFELKETISSTNTIYYIILSWLYSEGLNKKWKKKYTAVYTLRGGMHCYTSTEV